MVTTGDAIGLTVKMSESIEDSGFEGRVFVVHDREGKRSLTARFGKENAPLSGDLSKFNAAVIYGENASGRVPVSVIDIKKQVDGSVFVDVEHALEI